MKKKITINETKLAKFSAVAGAIIAGSSVNAQLQYTDVDPDLVIDKNYGPYNLDFNGDAITDLTLSVVAVSGSGTFTYSSIPFTYTYAGSVAAVQAGSGGGIVGTITGSSSTFMPVAMANGELISAAANFGSGGPLAVVGVAYIPAFSYSYPISQGDWVGVSDKFIGAKFMIGTNNHYGWVQLSVAADASTITIKDYAYNINTEIPLNAGQTAGLENFAVENKVTINNNLNEAFINCTPDLIGGRIVIINMAGQEMKTVTIGDVNTKISFEGLDTGIYTVAAQFESGTVNKRVYVK